jgi:2'-5' RNA ligase
MRTFIAIPLDDKTHNELAGLQAVLRSSAADVKWTQPSNIHLTLKFLGEIDDKKTKEISSALGLIAKTQKSFHLHLATIGAFPKPSFPRVIWVGIDEGANECMRLQALVEDSMERLGFAKEERTFSAHLTLGRVRSPKNKDRLIEIIEKEKGFCSSGKVLVGKIILFKSTLTSEGPIYTPLEEFPLL